MEVCRHSKFATLESLVAAYNPWIKLLLCGLSLCNDPNERLGFLRNFRKQNARKMPKVLLEEDKG